MRRREFLGALGVLAGSVAAAPPRRVYSFLWDNALVRAATAEEQLAVLANGSTLPAHQNTVSLCPELVAAARQLVDALDRYKRLAFPPHNILSRP